MDNPNEPTDKFSHEVVKTSLNILSGVIPFAGGILSAISASWSEHNQEKMNEFLKYRQLMLENELKEQWETIEQVILQIDKLKVDVSERIKSTEFQSLVQRCFNNWSGINSKSKKEYVKNILVNAAATTISSDDVIRLFIDWLNQYSDLHFQVIACIYKNPNGISRGHIWQNIGKSAVREDSAEADLYKLLIRDLSTGGIIRQYRPTDYNGNYRAMPNKKSKPAYSSGTLESAFELTKQYVLTELGQQFVHYTMSEISVKIGHHTEYDYAE
ncbi:TPA: hypothetical protein U0Z67_001831 [Legionella pneumophila]|nr:hypothetical protein [Legionella pneumophila]